jgi:hypothetical protein
MALIVFCILNREGHEDREEKMLAHQLVGCMHQVWNPVHDLAGTITKKFI